jgi:hypothetical protein
MKVKHYAEGRLYEPVNVIRDWELNFNLGSAVKYISRLGRKGTYKDALNDITKAIDYLEDERWNMRIEHMQEIMREEN